MGMMVSKLRRKHETYLFTIWTSKNEIVAAENSQGIKMEKY